jgi:glucokinase
MDARELFALDAASDARAHEIIDTAAENLARAVACVSFVVDPNTFVFGGSVALYNPHFIDLVHEHAKRYVLNPDSLNFALASCGEDAGLIGASLLV